MRRNVLNITASDVKDAKLTATVTIPAADVDAAIKKAYNCLLYTSPSPRD